MPGMLEYRLLDDGLKAGLTSSPDFFRTRDGLHVIASSSSLSSVVCAGESANDVRGMMMAVSVFDLECEILRASGVRAVGDVVCDTGSELVCPIGAPFLSGDPSLFKSIDRTASWSFLISTSLPRALLSSLSEFSDESGGDITAPEGIR